MKKEGDQTTATTATVALAQEDWQGRTKVDGCRAMGTDSETYTEAAAASGVLLPFHNQAPSLCW